MDTSDLEISFNADGVCNHCRKHHLRMRTFMKTGEEGEKALRTLVGEIKRRGRNREYDCIIGLSGGVDSSYVAYTVKKLGLRPLAVHLDNGWNTTEAVSNLKRCVTALNIDLHTEVLDWEEFRDLQVAFLRASTPDSEIPTDHAIGALMMKVAARYGLRYIIAGQNLQSEGLLPRSWSQGYHDWKYIRSVHRRFGTVPLKTYPHYTLLEHVYLKRFRRVCRIDILNIMPYDKYKTKEFLKREMGWQDYGGKHHESIYTRFYQTYVLPRKFSIDKRRAHLAPLVLSGLCSREDALRELEEPPCPPEQLAEDLQFVLKKLQLSREELDAIMTLPRRTIFDYPSYERSWAYRIGRYLYKILDGTALGRVPTATSA